MDPVEAISKPDVLEHLPIVVAILAILGAAVAFLIKKMVDAYKASKVFINAVVEESLPAIVKKQFAEFNITLPAMMDGIIMARLEGHERVEETKMKAAFEEIRRNTIMDRDEFERETRRSHEAIMSQLAKVGNAVDNVNAQLMLHDARLMRLEVQKKLRRKRSS